MSYQSVSVAVIDGFNVPGERKIDAGGAIFNRKGFFRSFKMEKGVLRVLGSKYSPAKR